MRRSLTALLLFVAAAPALAAQQAGQVIFVAGTVTVERPESIKLKKTDLVYEGDIIVTAARSRGQLLMVDGAKFSLRADTRFAVEEYFLAGEEREQPDGSVVVASDSSAVASLLKGGFRTISGAIGNDDPEQYAVKSPAATMGIRGTHYSAVFCSGDCPVPEGEPVPDGLYVGVTDGVVSIANDTGEYTVNPGEYYYVESFEATPVQLPAPPSILGDSADEAGEAAEESEEESTEESSEESSEEESSEEESSEEDSAEESSEESSEESAESSDESSEEGAAAEEGSADESAAGADEASGESAEASGESAPADSTAASGSSDDTTAQSAEAATEVAETAAAIGSSAESVGLDSSTEGPSSDGYSARSTTPPGASASDAPPESADSTSDAEESEESSEEEEATAEASSEEESVDSSSEDEATADSSEGSAEGSGDGTSDGTVASTSDTGSTDSGSGDTSGSTGSTGGTTGSTSTGSTGSTGGTTGSTSTGSTGSTGGTSFGDPGSFGGGTSFGSGGSTTGDTGGTTPSEPPIPITTEDGAPLEGGELPGGRAVAVGSGPVTGFSSTVFTGSSNLGLREFSADDLVRFQSTPTVEDTTYAIGTASLRDDGFDPTTGIGWGRWRGGAATITQPDGAVINLNLGMQSLHWVYGPDSAPTIPMTGTANYSLIAGNTDPTDTLGNAGVLGDATLSANFTNLTVQSELALAIAGRLWQASGSGSINSNLFDGIYNSLTIGGQAGGSGNFSGFFGAPGANGLPNGAGLTYGLNDGAGVSVSGAVVFGPPDP